MQIKTILSKLLDRQNLEAFEMEEVMRGMMSGELTDAQIAGFLVALRAKGETVNEIATAVSVMRQMGQKVPVVGKHVIDTCGTGGDGANTFNISTAAAFVVAAAGGQVAKHGNRSVSSRCGSADVLEEAGVNLDLTADQVAEAVNTLGVGFLFAAKHHAAARHTVSARRSLGIRTLFNLIGPLANPAAADHQLIGVFDTFWLQPMAQVLKQLGSRHVLVVSAEDGLDEISIQTATQVAELKNGEITCYQVEPEDFGFHRASLKSLEVQSARDSLDMIEGVLSNVPGPALDIVALNAGAAIYAADLADSLALGVEKALEVIASGDARLKLDALVAYSKSQS